MTKVKLCGFTRPDDAAHAVRAGADYLGLNFWPRSKRVIDVETAKAIAAAARLAGHIQLVGVFVDATAPAIAALVRAVGLDAVQVHGDEDVDTIRAITALANVPVWKAVGVAGAADIDDLARWTTTKDSQGPEVLMLDTATAGRGGSGTTFDWALAADAVRRYPEVALVLAGGLTPLTVRGAIEQVGPWAVDVASGIESAPGVKDAALVTAFVNAVRL
jgi:phosphoribosylanthranilate isomerase